MKAPGKVSVLGSSVALAAIETLRRADDIMHRDGNQDCRLIVLVVGPSKSGKSTWIRSMSLLLNAMYGESLGVHSYVRHVNGSGGFDPKVKGRCVCFVEVNDNEFVVSKNAGELIKIEMGVEGGAV